MSKRKKLIAAILSCCLIGTIVTVAKQEKSSTLEMNETIASETTEKETEEIIGESEELSVAAVKQYDTDGDGLSDEDEILLGLDPEQPKSDGEIPDAERLILQQLDENNISEALLAETNEAVPSLTLNIPGNVNKNVKIFKDNETEFGESRAVVGKPISIVGENITEGTLSFSLEEESVAQVYAEGSPVTYHTNLIGHCTEEGETEFLDTVYDSENHCISAEIDSKGTYFVVNVETMFHEMGMELPQTIGDVSDGNTLASGQAMAPADVVFVIDTTSSMQDEIDHVKENLSAFMDELKAKGVSAELALVTYEDIAFDGEDSTVVHKNGTSNWFYSTEEYKKVIGQLTLGNGGDVAESLVDALETARLLDMRASAGKIFVVITDATYKEENRYGISSMDAEIELLKNAQISCSVVSNWNKEKVYSDLFEETGGIWMNLNKDFHVNLTDLASQIEGALVGDGYWIYLQGPIPIPVRLDAKPEEGSKVDTDKDGIPDILELGSVNPTGSIDLDKLLTQVSNGVITGTNYGTVQMYAYNSNPGQTDTDFDGIEDSKDTSPNDNHGSGVMRYSIDGASYPINIEFNMDYRNFITEENTVYSRDLSMLSVLFATDVYDTAYIEVNQYANTGGSETGTNFGDLLGLEDSQYIAIEGANYAEDHDDITDFYVGHKSIVYNGEAHEIIIVSVRGTDGTNEEWSSNFDIGADTAEYYAATGSSHPHWKNKENHKGFDVAANRSLEKIEAYIKEHVNPYAKKSILITGHSRGAAIANILGTHFEEDSAYRSYTYTFATPATTTAANAASYETIFNILNTDDIITAMPVEAWGFSKYGESKAVCVEDYYENEIGAAEEGSWEWFMGGADYDNDYNTQTTLNKITKIASNREDFYILGETDSEKVWEDDLGHTTQAGAEEEMANLTRLLEEEKLLKFCNMYIVKDWFVYHVEINYCPAYLLQTLANMTTDVGPLLGRDVAGVYADAKTAFVASSGKVVIGGMTHPHMPPTYYIMSYHDLKPVY